MKKRRELLKRAVLLLCAVLLVSMLAGCGGKEQDSQPQQTGGADQTVGAQGQEPQNEPAAEPENEPADEPEVEEPAAEPEPEQKQTEYGSGTWVVVATGGEDNEYNELKLVDGELILHTLESDEGKGTFGEGSPIENSRYYGLTVEEIVAKFEERGFKVEIKAG